jgi:hypothetical protein
VHALPVLPDPVLPLALVALRHGRERGHRRRAPRRLRLRQRGLRREAARLGLLRRSGLRGGDGLGGRHGFSLPGVVVVVVGVAAEVLGGEGEGRRGGSRESPTVRLRFWQCEGARWIIRAVTRPLVYPRMTVVDFLRCQTDRWAWARHAERGTAGPPARDVTLSVYAAARGSWCFWSWREWVGFTRRAEFTASRGG